jgi:hypothetical protein
MEVFEYLKEYDSGKVERYIKYLNKLTSEVYTTGNQKGQRKNPWMDHRNSEQLADYFKAVAMDGLDFDGNHITLQSTGISYDYVAYKNKMFLAYPESLIDLQMVYKDDSFQFSKESGKVVYSHKISNPFGSKEADIIGGYCVIKNKRGEFLTTLNSEDFEKHRKVAKTDYIWKAWFVEMCKKTLIKKACKTHFSDEYTNIETLDNTQYDLENSLVLPLCVKEDLENIESVPVIEDYYKANSGKYAGMSKDFIKACATRKAAIVEALSNDNS